LETSSDQHPVKHGMPNIIEKVTAFITLSTPDGSYLLLFEHPHAGIQIPAGTVEPGETPESAAVREAAEETGLTALTLRRALGTTTESLTDHERVIGETTRVFARPDLSSFDWAALRRGVTVNVERQAAGFSHVTYIEYDRLEDPRYMTYQITGWLPTDRLADTRRRHFFHFEYNGAQSASWFVETDNHRFRLFWARLTELPPIVQPQDEWLEMLHLPLPDGSEYNGLQRRKQ
jgi:8-oxo-dGTP pyrophosphatase MutT (NUDIX family)